MMILEPGESFRWMGRAALVLCLVALGCGDPEPGVTNQVEPDAGNDVGEHDADAGSDDDVEDDTGETGGPVDGEGDNCPEISNPDQRDRSRDGVGDACANFPYYHDPSNPQSVEIIHEDDGDANDSFWDGRLNWNLELPFMLEGTVDAPGDLDFYAFEIEEPTTLLIHMEPQSTSLWPAMIVTGDDTANRHVESVILGPNQGEEEVRDVHLPVPGMYIVVFSDFHNLSGGQQTSAGGPDYHYRISMSMPPLPKAESVSLPTPRKIVPYDEGEAAVFGVDVEGQDTLTVEATGAPRNQNSMLMPSVQFLDAETGKVFAFSVGDEVDTDSMRTEVSMKVGDELDRVDVLIEGFQSLGQNDVVVDISAEELEENPKTFGTLRDERADGLLWMRPGSAIRSMIGPPIAQGATSLVPDEDFFLFFANPGEFIEVEARPNDGSLLIPEVTIGELWSSNFFSSWHQGFSSGAVGDAGSASMLLTRDNFRDAVFRVVQAGNSSTELPVGGPEYSYDLIVDSVAIDDVAHKISTFPADITISLGSGEQGIYDIDFSPGYRYDIDFDGRFGRSFDLVDTDTWEIVESTRGSMSFVHEPGRDVIGAIRDDSGTVLSEEDGIELHISEGAGPQNLAVPGIIDSVLDDSDPDEIFAFDVQAGDIFEARTAADGGPNPEVQLFGDGIEVGHSNNGSVAVARADQDGSVLAVVSRSSSQTVQYSLGVHFFDPTDESLPYEKTGELVDEMKGVWSQIDVDTDRDYVVNTVGTSQSGEPIGFAVFDAQTMERLVDSDDGFAVFDSGSADEVLLVVGDPAGPQSPPVDFGVSLSEVDPLDDDGVDSVEFLNGMRPVFVDFDHDGGGLSTVELVGSQAQNAIAEIASNSYDIYEGSSEYRQLAVLARSSGRNLMAVIIPDKIDDQIWSVDIEIEDVPDTDAVALGSDEAIDSSPLLVDDWPGAFQGRLDDDTPLRVFEMDVQNGDLLWALAIPYGDTTAVGMYPRLSFYGPGGGFIASDSFSGEGNFPLISALEVTETGQWSLELEDQISFEGDFVLYILQR